MNVPIAEKCRQALLSALRGINRASGYSSDLEVEEHDPLNGHRVRDGLCVVSWGGDEDYDSQGLGKTDILYTFNLDAYVIQSDQDEIKADVRRLAVLSDLRQAILLRNFHLGNTSQHTHFGRREPIEDENGGIIGVRVPVVCRVRSSLDNPYEP